MKGGGRRHKHQIVLKPLRHLHKCLNGRFRYVNIPTRRLDGALSWLTLGFSLSAVLGEESARGVGLVWEVMARASRASCRSLTVFSSSRSACNIASTG